MKENGTTTVLIWLILLVSFSLFASDHPTLARGAGPGSMAFGGGIDTVNLFNGSVNASIPLGVRYPVSGHLSYGFKLYYSSKVWDYEQIENMHGGDESSRPAQYHCGSNGPLFCTEAHLSEAHNVGPGWRISFGELKSKSMYYNGSQESIPLWIYVAPDGSEHTFYPTHHVGEIETQGIAYTRDNTYLRLNEDPLAQGQITIEFPNGTMHIFKDFDPITGDLHDAWRLWRMEDRWGNWVEVDYQTTQDIFGDYFETWAIEDSTGRTHGLDFTFDDNGTGSRTVISGIGRKRLVRADLGAPHGGTAEYTFDYEPKAIPAPCKDDSLTTPEILTDVNMLSGVWMPNGNGSACIFGDCEKYLITSYGVDELSSWSCNSIPPSPSEQPGTIRSLRLPTGGMTEWTYQDWKLPARTDPAMPILERTTGVDTKTVHSDNDLSATWTYTPDLLVSNTDMAIVNRVTDPNGNDSQYFFRTRISQSESDWNGWGYGLPYNLAVADSFGKGTYLSARHYEGSYSSGTLLRTDWVKYNHDILPALPASGLDFDNQYVPQHWYNSNRRVRRRMTTFEPVDPLEPQKYSLTKFGLFDGLGHFRRQIRSGNFAEDDATMIVVTNFNPTHGQYVVNEGTNTEDPTSTYVPWDVANEWILSTYDYIRPNRYTGTNEVIKRFFCFDETTGALNRTRILQNKNQTRRADDIIVEYERGADGNLVEERHYGADSQSLSTATDLCSLTLPTTPVYQIGHSSLYGVRKASWYEDPANGTNSQVYLQNSQVDANTGLVTKETDTSGYWIQTTYDALLRSINVTTANAAKTQITYARATGSASEGTLVHAEIQVTTEDRFNSTILGQNETEYDGLGKTFKERHLVSDGQWVERQTHYTNSGRLHQVSTWGSVANPTGWTTYDDYDRWGRPGLITPPDGINHAVTLDYTDVSSVARTVNVGTGQGQETPSTTMEFYDSHGGLRKVTEPSDPGGADQDWFYDYDVHGNLATVTGGVQTREFTYDGLGYLRSEDIPEREGPITYDAYDPLGNVLAMTEDDSRSRSKTFSYDSMNRLTNVYSGSWMAKEYEYWPTTGGADWNQGRLEKTTRHHEGAMGSTGTDVARAFEYKGIGANVSKVTTEIGYENEPPGLSFVQDYTWDDLGNLKTLNYPRLDGVNQRVVTHTYDRGWLEGISDNWGSTFVSAIDYHANGMVSFVTHGNGVGEQTVIAANGIARPTEINAASLDHYWTTGQIGYDGAGNITTMDNDTFIYDAVSRLKSSRVFRNNGLETRTTDFVYDIYGNLTQETATTYISGRSPETVVTDFIVDEATNRLTGENYDYHGQQTSLFWGEGKTLFPYWDYHFEEITRIGNSATGAWLYDADSERIAEDGRYFIRDLDGKVLAEFEGETWKRDYLYRGSQMVAIQDSTDGLSHFHLDHLGSPRMVTDSGGFMTALHDYGPFGAEISNPYQNTITKKYTSHERDNPNTPGTKFDLDYMHARYYSPWQHRFLSVDPIGGDPRQPQSWNAFSYVLNNPINLVDPYGMAAYTPDSWWSYPEIFIGEITVTGEIDYIASYENWKNAGWYGQDLDPNALEVMRIVGQAAPLARAYEFLADIYSGFFHGGGAVDDILRAGLARLPPRVLKSGWFAINFGGSWPGTTVPRSFDLVVGGQQFFVHPNATKHLAEYAVSRGGRFPLTPFAEAVIQTMGSGLNKGRNFVRQGAWELGIDTADNTIYHAVYRP